jgi:hypothetical protein
METLQQTRRANLRALLVGLADEGMSGLEAQATFLATRAALLKGMLENDAIPTLFARNVEWTFQRRDGWLDEEHGADPS